MVADKAAVLNTLKTCKPILKQAKEKNLLIMLPLPRHIINPCCGDSAHCTNRSRVDYYTNIKEGLAAAREVTTEYLQTNKYEKARVLDPLFTTKGMAIADIWDEAKGSPQQGVYTALAASIRKLEATITGNVRKRKADEETETQDRQMHATVARDHKGPGNRGRGFQAGHKGQPGNQYRTDRYDYGRKDSDHRRGRGGYRGGQHW